MNAASSDSQEVVKCILKQPNIEINSKDIFSDSLRIATVS